MNTDNFSVPLKYVIPVVLWILSIAGVYYTMKFQIDVVQEKTVIMEGKLDTYDLKIIDFKITLLEKEIKSLNEKADKIQELIISIR